MNFISSLFVFSDFEKTILNSHSDFPLIAKHSQIRKFTINNISLSLRVLHVPHYRGHKLPTLPLILCIHGLGGQLSQFHAIIDNLSHFAEVVSVDLPGHGKSQASTQWAPVYTPEFLTQLLAAVLSATCSEPGREVVLLAHSLGCSLATRLSKILGIRCLGIIAICPPLPLIGKQKTQQSLLGWIPAPIFNVFRAIDKVGGLYSPSVSRMLSPNNHSDELRAQQLYWNLQVQTSSWLRMAYFASPSTEQDWRQVDCPVLLIAAECDVVTLPENVAIIAKWLGPQSAKYHSGQSLFPTQSTSNPLILKNQESAAAHDQEVIDDISSDVSDFSPMTPIPDTLNDTNSQQDQTPEPKIVHDTGHMCLIEKPEAISGLISDFIATHVDVKLSLGWQLAFLASKKDKWSLKNESKWRQVEAVSDIIEGTFFRAMKTLRQDDPEHSPQRVEQKYPDLTDVIDISRETPPYDPSTFKHIIYHKFPTVSKLPPSRKEVAVYIKLVNSIRINNPNAIIGTHCHYGFNRTGFFLCCYMIEQLGFTIKKALMAFRNARNPGIKHSHFIDELYVRYEL